MIFLEKTLNIYITFNYFFLFISISLLIAICLLLLSFILAMKTPEYEKSTPYECGFDPFNDARGFFNIQFYTLGILFIIFDLELAYFFLNFSL